MGGPAADFLSSLPAVHITMSAPDNPDDAHYTLSGARSLAGLVESIAV